MDAHMVGSHCLVRIHSAIVFFHLSLVLQALLGLFASPAKNKIKNRGSMRKAKKYQQFFSKK
jgi:hypothetical protein